MQVENVSIQNLISQFKAFSVEGFNIFGIGEDNLPHLICACPNKDFARAIQSLLLIAKKAQSLEVVNAYITSNCYLSPRILVDGTLGMVATVINDAVYIDGKELLYNEPEFLHGTQEYEAFSKKFLMGQNEEGD